jgi:hypothetical protein
MNERSRQWVRRGLGAICVVMLVVAPVLGSSRASIVHTVAAGETISDIAERFLGDKQHAPELLKFNAISNPLEVTEGSLIAIPGDVRAKALAAAEETEQALADAMEAQAPTFARETYLRAEKLAKEARSAWDETAYAQSESRCLLAIAHARHSILLADKNAPVGRESTVVVVHGTCEADPAGGEAWQPLKAGDKVPFGASLRTGGDSRLQLALYDGTFVQLKADSTVMIKDMIEDRRSGKMTMKLRVILGGILTEMKGRKTEDSSYRIESGETVTAIRGTALRVNTAGEGVTRVVTLHGDVETSGDGWLVSVPAETGLLVEDGRRAKPVELLPPPIVDAPAVEPFSTASQQLAFKWEPVGKRPLLKRWGARFATYRAPRETTYHLEIATDDIFNHVVQDVTTWKLEAESPVLAPGDYYWRIASLNEKGLEGVWSETSMFSVERNLKIALGPDRDLVHHGGRMMGGPGTMVAAQPKASDTSVDVIHYSINGGAFQAFPSGVVLSDEGAYTIRARAVGLDGHIGSEEQVALAIDATVPQINMHYGYPQLAESGGLAVPVTIKAMDNERVARIEVSIDGAAFVSYSEPVLLDADVDHVLSARAIDLVGNVSPVRTMQVSAIRE